MSSDDSFIFPSYKLSVENCGSCLLLSTWGTTWIFFENINKRKKHKLKLTKLKEQI